MKTAWIALLVAALLVADASAQRRLRIAANTLANLPLIDIDQFTSIGGFRGTDSFTSCGDWGNAQVGQAGIALGTANDRLFGHSTTCIHEMTIPALVSTSNPALMNKAGIVSGNEWADPAEGDWPEAFGNPENPNYRVGGMLWYNNRLIVGGFIEYDANNTATTSTMARTLPLSGTSYVGTDTMWANSIEGIGKVQGFVSQYFIPVPQQWQSALGGPAIGGGTCMSVASRTSSSGPAALSFNPDNVNVGVEPIPMTPLMYYGDLGPPNGSATDPEWNNTTCVVGGVIFEGTRTLMFYGTHGIGEYCYGGVPFCTDPEDSASGNHAYPYVYMLYFYDLLDLAAVKAGTKSVTSVMPYAIQQITFPTGNYPTGTLRTAGAGIAYNTSLRRLFLGQARCWPQADSWNFPCFHAYSVDITP